MCCTIPGIGFLGYRVPISLVVSFERKKMLYQADYSGYFEDIRLERRGRRLLERLFHNGTKSLQAISLSRAEQKGFYHLLRSEKVSEQKLIEEMAACCAKAARDKVVLAIQDTTEVNLGAHQHRLDLHSGLGRIDSPYAGDALALNYTLP